MYRLLLIALAALPACAQARFEVSSVRPSMPGARFRINFRGDRFEAQASTVGDILDMMNQ